MKSGSIYKIIGSVLKPIIRRAVFNTFLLILGLGLTRIVFSQTVTTIAGGRISINGPDYGFRDGDSKQESQFNYPVALALDKNGFLFVADKNNNAIRRLNLTANRTETISTNVPSPVGIAFDRGNLMYVLSSVNGLIYKFDTNYNLLGIVNTNGAFVSPTAFTIDGSTNFYVVETSGLLKRVHPSNGTPVLVVGGFSNPNGVAILNNGLVAVSDTGNHAVKLVNPANSAVSILSGGNGAGFSNGIPAVAKFNSPRGIAIAPDGTLVVADTLNHRVRLVYTNGYTATLYGVDPSLWEYCPNCTPPVYEGWADGTVSNSTLDPAAREPVGVVVSADGRSIYTTEVYYHIIRAVTGINLSPGGGTGGDTNVVVVTPPTISPDSGYYPDGIKIAVSSPNPDVFYTTDGSEPTTNSLRVQMSGNTGIINWTESSKDLSWLKVKAFNGTNASITVSGKPPQSNSILISRDRTAGPGSTILVPVVATIKPGFKIRSMQFLAQITPNGGAPIISDQFRITDITTNDFIQVASPALDKTRPALISASSLLIGNSRSLIITAIGTNANFEVSSYAVVAMLVVPIPASASIGNSYTIQIVGASATSDGLPSSADNNVALEPSPPRTILITNIAYTVGDTASAGWYGAGEFGDGKLLNNDVLNAFYASLGIRTPPAFTDLFDAMDAFPDDEPGIPGGDGDIRFLDWQRILIRSLGLYTNTIAGTNWSRYWTTGGVRTNDLATISIAASPIQTHSENNRLVWQRDGRIGAISVGNAQPSSTVDVPIYFKSLSDAGFSTLQFRISVMPSEGAPELSQPPQFIPNGAAPFVSTVGLNQLVCAWAGFGMGSTFNPPLTGSNIIGFVRIQIPASATAGNYYVVRFHRADSGSGNTQFNLESIPGAVWVLNQPSIPFAVVSDEWKTNFFGNLTNRWADPQADPDADGVPNWLEFASGTDPVKPRFHNIPNEWTQNGNRFKLRWFGRPGKRYIVEVNDSLTNSGWTQLQSVNGTGDIIEIDDTRNASGCRFYRLRVVDP